MHLLPILIQRARGNLLWLVPTHRHDLSTRGCRFRPGHEHGAVQLQPCHPYGDGDLQRSQHSRQVSFVM